MLRSIFVALVMSAAAATPATAQTDNNLTNFPASMGNGNVIPVHPPDASSPELEEMLEKIEPTTANAIRDAVEAGDLTIGHVDMGNDNFGFHDKDTIGLDKNRKGDLVEGPALAHEWQHRQNALANGEDNDPTVVGPCGASTHATMVVGSMADLCELITASTSPSAKAKACANWKTLHGVATGQVRRANAATGCPPNTPAPPPVPTSCSGCP